MTGYNLPPGCNESDIPGNRPYDIEFDIWLNEVISAAENEGLFWSEDYDDLPFEDWFDDGLTVEEAIEKIKLC